MTEEQRYRASLEFATRMHEGQTRIGGADYITHPIAVAQFLKDHNYPIEYQIAGLFHDLLEDTAATVEEINQLGGIEVADAVALLTKEPGYQMENYIQRVKANPIAVVVKASDRYHNLSCAIMADEAFKRKYAIESIEWYLDLGYFRKEIDDSIERLVASLKSPLYELLFPFIPYFELRPEIKWGGGLKPDGTLNFPYPIYGDEISRFIEFFYFSGVIDKSYFETLKNHSVEVSHESIAAAIPSAEKPLLRAMLTCYIRQERFCDGLIASAVKNGNIVQILKRMKDD